MYPLQLRCIGFSPTSFRFRTIMTDHSLNISIPLKFDVRTPPLGMTDYDPKALSAEQQIELNNYKYDTRKENINFLQSRPELKAIVSLIMRRVIVQKPRNAIEFVAKLFSRPKSVIREEVNRILEERPLEFDLIPPGEYDEWDY